MPKVVYEEVETLVSRQAFPKRELAINTENLPHFSFLDLLLHLHLSSFKSL